MAARVLALAACLFVALCTATVAPPKLVGRQFAFSAVPTPTSTPVILVSATATNTPAPIAASPSRPSGAQTDRFANAFPDTAVPFNCWLSFGYGTGGHIHGRRSGETVAVGADDDRWALRPDDAELHAVAERGSTSTVAPSPSLTPFKEQVTCWPFLSMWWVIPPPRKMFIGERYQIAYYIYADPSLNSSIIFPNGASHTVVHACKDGTGACIPDVTTPGLVTPSLPYVRNWDNAVNQTLYIELSMVLNEVTQYVMIAHVELRDPATQLQYDAAITVPYPVLVQPRLDTVDAGVAARAVIWTIAGVVAVYVTGLLGFVVIFGLLRHPVIVASTISFSVLVLISLLVLLAALIPMGVTPSDASCAIVPWMLVLPPAFALSLTLVKSWRIWYMLGRKTKELKKAVSDWMLLLLAVLPMIIPMIVLAVWTGADRYVAVSVQDVSSGIKYAQCGHSSPGWSVAMIAYLAAMVCTLLVLAYLTRNVVTLFHEARWIAYSIYVVILGACVGIPLYATTDDPTDKLYFAGFAISISVFGVASLLYLPKVWLVCTHSSDDFLPVGAGGGRRRKTGLGVVSSSDDAGTSKGKARGKAKKARSKAGSNASSGSGSRGYSALGSAALFQSNIMGTLGLDDIQMDVADDDDDNVSQAGGGGGGGTAAKFWSEDGTGMIDFDVLDVFVNSRTQLADVLTKQADGFRLAHADVEQVAGAYGNLRAVARNAPLSPEGEGLP